MEVTKWLNPAVHHRRIVKRTAQGGIAGGVKQGSLRERVRCSSLVDWPVYPRLKRSMG